MHVYCPRYIYCRNHKDTMVKLKNILPDSSKDRRHRINLINLHIAVIEWIVEFSGFFLILLGSFILGHDSSMVTISLQTATVFLFFNILPCTLLVNDSKFKGNIAKSHYYIMFLNIFNCK